MAQADTVKTMVARRAGKGCNVEESRALLAELIDSHAGNNLATALVYNEFATERQAEKFAGI